MKIITFQGGLGNQLFIYNFYKYVVDRFPKQSVWGFYDDVVQSHNGLEIDKWFDIQLPKQPWFVKYIKRTCTQLQKYNIRKVIVDENCYSDNAIVYMGYWQNKLYLSKENIHFKKLTYNDRNKNALRMIEKSNSVSIHVRRGDYLLPQYRYLYSGICTKGYYEKAVSICRSRILNPSFFVFSDDIQWAKENLPVDDSTVFVDWNSGHDSAYDMFLMSHCKFNVIANSTFSFWGAYLNQNSLGTIFPKQWINDRDKIPDIFPKDWMGL